MNGITIYEFDALVSAESNSIGSEGLYSVPVNVFSWLEDQCLRSADAGDGIWLRPVQRQGQRAIQVTSFVGVIRGPGGFQIEVLPKVGRAIGGGAIEAQQLLIEMLRCLRKVCTTLAEARFERPMLN